MQIKTITLDNFRNYERQSFEFTDGINIIYGDNAVGKTNLIESVYLAALGKSPRTSRENELVRWGAGAGTVRLTLSTKFREYLIEMHVDDKSKKRIAINKIPVKKIDELIGVMNLVFFSPNELRMIKDGPEERRRFMDIYLSQRKKIYFRALMRYNRILAQRNKSIKTMSESESRAILPAWDVQLAREGAVIIKNRYEFLCKLKVVAAEKHALLSDSRESLSVEYKSLISDGELATMERELLKIFERSVKKDIALGFTSVGPQRDDIAILVNGAEVKKFGSQGQQRTAALSLKFAEASLFLTESGEPPIVILDDVLSELDANRQRLLINETSGYQTLVTCTRFFDAESQVKNYINITDKGGEK